jgi:co-chaperonin GroES (HSP10)
MLVANDGKIIVQKIGGPRETKGGIILPDNMRGGKSEMGTVVSCGYELDAAAAVNPYSLGNGRPRYEPGQTVVFSAFSGSDIDIGGEHYLAMLITDVLCHVEDEPAQ